MIRWLRRGKSVPDAPDLFTQAITARVRPRYKRQIKRGVDPESAYAQAYEDLAKLLAKVKGTTVEKVKFSAIDVLQKAMYVVTH